MRALMSAELRVGYVPYSADLQHPGDRRRLLIWAEANHVKLETEKPLNSDLLILSNGANFNYWIKRTQKPVVLDLVDGYLGEKPNWVRDFVRNIVRAVNGKSNFQDITYTRSLKKACRESKAIIVATPEQRESVLPFNKNVYVILDDHSELLQSVKREVPTIRKEIFWEGFGYTLKHFKTISRELDEYLSKNQFVLNLLTTESFARWGGYLGRIETSKLVKKWFPNSFDKVRIVPWTLENVKSYANKSDFAIIPIDTNDRFANLKPENKLLGLWTLGLQVLFSDTPAYKRVAIQAGLESACIDRKGWKEALENHQSLLSLESSNLANNYLAKFHAREILIQKWEEVILNSLKSA